jgi:hypothetical protein
VAVNVAVGVMFQLPPELKSRAPSESKFHVLLPLTDGVIEKIFDAGAAFF